MQDIDMVAVRRSPAATVSRWWFQQRADHFLSLVRKRRRVVFVKHRRKTDFVLVPTYRAKPVPKSRARRRK